MALTRITKGVIKPNENYDTHNIVSTGIVTAVGLDINGNADISGNFSVGGVLTYEDVTSIDSVGIITARSGVITPNVDVDDFLDVGSNIKLGNAGVITATSFVGSGAALTGIDATAIKDSSGNVKVQAQASGAIYTGIHTFNSDIDVDGHTNLDNVSVAGVITATGDINASNLTLTDNNPTITWIDTDNNPDYRIEVNGGNFTLHDITNAVNKFEITPAGNIEFVGNVDFLSGGVDITGNTTMSGDLDVDGHTNLDNVSIAGVVTATSLHGSGTGGIKLPVGTTAQRVNTTGTIRFNSTLELPEYYNGSAWISIDSPPAVSSVSPTEVESAAGGNITFTINGSRFSVGANVRFISNTGTELTPSSVTRVSASQLTAVIAKNSFVNGQEPYDVKVTNSSGLASILADQINVDNAPAWVTSSGSLGTHSNYATVNVTVSATDPEGDTVTYSVQSGSLPSGLSLNTSTGAITGTIGAVGSSTTVNFTLRATAGGKTADRAFSFVQSGPGPNAYAGATSYYTWTKPSGLTSLTAYVWAAGGGGGGQQNGSGGKGQAAGAGGYAKAVIDVSSYSTLYIVAGKGGQSGQVANNSNNVGGGCGGGLSGIFSSPPPDHGDAVLIAGAGGGGSGDSNGQAGEGGGGGGANQNGRDGLPDERISQRTNGLGGTTSAGGAAANASSSSSYTHTNPTNGYALGGGNSGSQASGQSLRPSSYLQGGRSYIATNGNWMGGGGGSGYWGGGGGICGYAGGGGGGSGYAKGSVCSAVAGTTGSDGSQQSTTAAPENSSIYYASGVAQGGMPAADGGDGRVVLVY